MANSNIETSFQNLVNVIKEKTFSATDGATLQAAVADIQIDITDLGISKIGISQIGMAGGVASLGLDGKVPDSQLPEISSGGGIVRAFSAFAFNKGGFYGSNVWTDGTDIYQSNGSSQWVLDQSNLTWSDKTWNGYTSIIGAGVWTDGTNIYYSNGSSNQYVLDKATSTWSAKTWTGITNFQGGYIWTDGTDIYYSNGTSQWVLDKATSTWSTKAWAGLTNYTGNNVWTDGENIYYSQNTTQYVLDKSTSTWTTKAWTGVTGITGSKIWKDGTKIHYSNNATQAVLDRTLNTWNDENWFGDVTSIDGSNIWSIGTEIFYNNGSASGHLVDYDMAQMLEQNNGIATLGSNGRLKETQTYYVSAGKKSSTTLGNYATAEGSNNTASGNNSHAEGYTTQATGSSAHSEGAGTKATGENSHAEGWDTIASHKASHAGGYGTQTGAQYQSVIGKHNIGKATTAFEIGNGTNSSNRANIFEVDWSGNATFAGDVTATVNNVTIPLSDAQLQTLSSAITIGGTSYTTVEDSIEALNDTKTDIGHSHQVSDITDFPTLPSSFGTAASKDVPASGNASASQVVMGNDTRLSDARTPVAHTHTKSDITNLPSIPTFTLKTLQSQTITSDGILIGFIGAILAAWCPGGGYVYIPYKKTSDYWYVMVLNPTNGSRVTSGTATVSYIYSNDY